MSGLGFELASVVHESGRWCRCAVPPSPALTLNLTLNLIFTLTLTPTPALILTPTLTQVYWWAIQTYRRQHPEHQFTLESVQQLVLG